MTRMTLLAATVLAAPAMLPGMAAAQPVTGLYIGGAGGGNFLQREFNRNVVLNGVRQVTSQPRSFDAGYTGLASLGYGFGNGLRVEAEGDFRHNDLSSSGNGPRARGREEKYGGMVNALFDLDVGSPYVFPYIGAGAGYSWVDRRYTLSAPLTTTVSRGVDSSFAYQAIAGVSFPIPPVVGLSVTAEYRFFSLAGDRTFGERVSSPAPLQTGRITTTDDYNHSLMLGLRYAFNVPPPPVEAAPAPAPARVEARTYLVFFDWDRADLTDRARQIIAEAAQATQRVQTTRIEVAGHTDSSGTAQYNQGLSVRRAQTVAAELVRLGVPRAAITVQGLGETQPLVQTAKGVREPQNRRVEIVLR